MLQTAIKLMLGCCLAITLLIPAGGACAKPSEKVLYSFTSGSDGANPFADLIADKNGNLYSTTVDGGSYGSGTIFELAPDGTESVLYSFTGGNDGNQAQGGLIMDKSGNLYGTTVNGGANGRGAVFELLPDGNEVVLYSFTGGSDGANPWPALIMDKQGNLYGTANDGAANNGGTVFKLAPDGTETVLYPFCIKTNCEDGSNPYGSVIADSKGNLYGTTVGGGANGRGNVFKLTPKAKGYFKETILYNFCAQSGCSDGAASTSSLLMDGSGNLYGVTLYGGNSSNDGVVFKIATDGTETVLHTFCSKKNCTDGASPNGGFLIMDTKGDLYGVTEAGGKSNNGTVFEIAPRGTETVLYSFAGGNDGAGPHGGLLMDKKGNLYGTTSNGGGSQNCGDGCGTVFEVTK